MTLKINKSTKAILFSLFSFVGLGGIGHFYLNKFKEGFVFLIGGIILELFVFTIFIISFGLFFSELDFDVITIIIYLTTGASLFIISLLRILYILKKEK